MKGRGCLVNLIHIEGIPCATLGGDTDLVDGNNVNEGLFVVLLPASSILNAGAT
jgi:hypothetical protein